MIALADYGASNTRSVLRALLAAGAEAPTLTDDAATLRRAERVVLPGVGNFAAAKRRLDETGLGDAITDVAKSGRPVLGICLGLQLFLSDSEEAPGVPGLGLLPGRVARFRTELPVPHVGWARVRLTAGGRAHGALAAAFDGDEAFFYHVHSYHPVGVDAAGALRAASNRSTVIASTKWRSVPCSSHSWTARPSRASRRSTTAPNGSRPPRPPRASPGRGSAEHWKTFCQYWGVGTRACWMTCCGYASAAAHPLPGRGRGTGREGGALPGAAGRGRPGGPGRAL